LNHAHVKELTVNLDDADEDVIDEEEKQDKREAIQSAFSNSRNHDGKSMLTYNQAFRNPLMT
jgi:hypothetical protein